MKTNLIRWPFWALTAAFCLASGMWLFSGLRREIQAQTGDEGQKPVLNTPERPAKDEGTESGKQAPSSRTGKFLSLHYGRVETEWMVEAAKRVDMMLFSANVQVTVPQAVRKANPNVFCLGYLNTLDFDGRRGGKYLETPSMRKEWPDINRREDWFLHDDKGQRVLVYMHTGARERYAIDRANPQVQRYLSEKAKEIVDAGYDGVFLDNFGLELLFRRKDKYSGFPAGMTNAQWQEGGWELLAAIKQAVGKDKLVIYNGLHGGASQKRSSFQTDGVSPFEAAIQAAEVCDGGMWEGYFGWRGLALNEANLRRTVDTLAAYNKRDKVTVALATGESEDDAKVRFCLYLLSLDGEHAYFSYVPNYQRIRWYPIFDTDIGKPVADYELRDGIATRRFEKGFVAVNATERKAAVTLPRPYQTRLTEKIEKLTLLPKSGEILFDLSVKIKPPETKEGISAKYLGDVGIEKDEAVIFSEGFEGGKIPTVGYGQMGGFFDLKGYPKEMYITGKEAAVGGHSLELIHPAGVISPQWLHRKFPGQDTVYVRFYRKYEKDWMWPPNGAHDTYLFAGQYDNPASADLTLYLDIPQGPSQRIDKGNWDLSKLPELVLKSSFQGPGLDFGLNREIVSHVGWDNYYSTPYNRQAAPIMQGDRWYCFEYMAKMNSAPDKKDGEVRLWVDGQLVTEMTGLVLRNASHKDIKWDHWMLGPRYGGTGFKKGPPRQQTSWIDAIVVSRSYIGPAVAKRSEQQEGGK